MKVSGIYKIQSKKKPSRIYIGSAVNIKARWRNHLFDLRQLKHHSKKLQRHYNKYGENDLVFSVLLGCDKNDLIKHEQYFMDSLETYFNICKTAGSAFGLKRGHPWNYGKKLNLEYRAKLSDAHKGQPAWNKGKSGIYSEDVLNKMKQSLRGRDVWNKGKHYKNPKMIGNKNSLGRKASEET